MRLAVTIVVTVGTKLAGLIVDAVSDVVEIANADIQAVPHVGKETETQYISGIAKAGTRAVVLLDSERMVDRIDAVLGAAVSR